MAAPRVFVTRIIPDQGLRLIQECCDVDLWMDELPPSRDVLIEHARGVDGLLTLLTDRIDGEVMDAAGRNSRSFPITPLDSTTSMCQQQPGEASPWGTRRVS